MDNGTLAGMGIMIAIIFVSGFFLTNDLLGSKIISMDESVFKDAIYIKAPFGIYAVESSGSFFIGTGSFSSSLTESYSVKYMEGIELKTKILDAERTSVVADGTLRLEIQEIFDGKIGRWTNSRIGYIYHKNIIHIPEFLSPNETKIWSIVK